MDEFFASSLQAPLLTNNNGGNSSFNLQDSHFSQEFINGYVANNTENFLFSDSDPSATSLAFNCDTGTGTSTGTSFLPNSCVLPLLYSQNNLMEQTMLELIGCIEGENSIQPDKNEIHGLQSPVFGSEPMPNDQATLLQAKERVSNGKAKTRTRARRGQATDPHSIAERERRGKIATRLKNLQELVPNSNEVDKSAMLDEAIGYVKFLQIQVKVLSVSRMSGPGAPFPLFTESQTEKSTNETTASDMLGLEREVVRLMDYNMIDAIQFLQRKGLCLVPIKLAHL